MLRISEAKGDEERHENLIGLANKMACLEISSRPF
jgi:hypothetical protein